MAAVITARFVDGPYAGQVMNIMPTPEIVMLDLDDNGLTYPTVPTVRYRRVIEHDRIAARGWPVVHYEVSG